MRRRAAALLLSALLAPAGLRVAAGAARSGAQYCPLKCPHDGAAMAGADCCPIGEDGGNDCSLRRCSRDQAPAVVPLGPGQPALLIPIARLTPPEGTRSIETAPRVLPRSASLRLPDHVPLPSV
jgi:hypothetical protein